MVAGVFAEGALATVSYGYQISYSSHGKKHRYTFPYGNKGDLTATAATTFGTSTTNHPTGTDYTQLVSGFDDVNIVNGTNGDSAATPSMACPTVSRPYGRFV